MSVGFVHRVAILRKSPASEDDWGFPAGSEVVVASDVPALIQARRVGSRESAVPLDVPVANGVGFFAVGSDIRSGDVVVRGSERWEVMGLPRDAGGAGHHLEVDLRRIEP